MPTHRCIEKSAGTGERVSALSHFGFRVWLQYQLSADDYGVCPAEAMKLQGENLALQQEPTRKVQAQIERLIDLQLCGVFQDGSRRYLYQSDWQDYQRIKHPSRSSLPPIPAELLEKCSEKTRELFLQHSSKSREGFCLHARGRDATATATANAYANAYATATPNSEAEPIRPARPVIAKRNFNAAYEHPRFDVPQWWHTEHVKGLPGGEDEILRFYRWLSDQVNADPQMRTEPRKPWLAEQFAAWLRSTAPAASSGVPSAEETRRRYADRERAQS